VGPGNEWFIGELCGIRWLFDSGATTAQILKVHNLFACFKCFNLFFLFLQSRIYTSDGFTRFVKRDLKKLVALAKNYKRVAMTYRFNNEKLQKVITAEENKKKMYKGVSEFKLKMELWKDMVKNNLQRTTAAFFGKDIESNFQVEVPQYEEGSQKEDSQRVTPANQKSVSFFDIKNVQEPLLQYDEPSMHKVPSARGSIKTALLMKLQDAYQLDSMKDLLEKGDDYF